MAHRSEDALEREVRTRTAKLPRSRDGCKTCRIRRIKCDQTRPNCDRCSKTGRWCEWFDKSPGSSTPRPSTPRNVSPPDLTYRTAINVSQSPHGGYMLPGQGGTDPPWNSSLWSKSPYTGQKQLRSFEYFCKRTAPQLSGHFSARFWEHDVLQASFHNDTLRHAIAALGSLHERFEKSDPTIFRTNKDLTQGGFALQQYIQSISLLAKPADGSPRTEVDVYLIACLLFASFEMLRGHHGSAIQHVHCGVRILAELAGGSSESGRPAVTRPKYPLVPLEALAIIFTRLEIQAQQILGFSVYPPGIASLWSWPEECFCDDVPEFFTSIESARNSLEFSGSDINRILVDPAEPFAKLYPMNKGSPRYEQDRQRVLNRINAWYRALDATLKAQLSHPTFSAPDMRAGRILKMIGTLLIIALSTAGSQSEMIFDEYAAEYEYAVDQAAAVAEGCKQYFIQSEGRPEISPRFQMDQGIIIALFEIVRKCRVSAIRWKAIRVLENYPWQEGLWDGLLVAKYAREVLSIEAGEDDCNLRDGIVPEWARIGELHLHFDREDRW